MTELKELLTEYASITGRPIATISVTEFLELKSYTEKSNAVPVVMQHTSSAISEPATDKHIEPQVISMPEPVREKAVEPDNTPQKTEKKPISSAFMMMRSIGG